MKTVKFSKKLKIKKEVLAKLTLSNEELMAVNGRLDDVPRTGLNCGSAGQCSNAGLYTCSFITC